MRKEKIGSVAGKTTYRDLRDGLARIGLAVRDMTESDVAHALGAMRDVGVPILADVLELYYAGSAVRRECVKLRLRQDLQWGRDADVQAKAERIRRFAAELAIQDFTGQRVTSAQLKWAADLLVCRPARLQECLVAALAMLHDWRVTGERQFVRVAREKEAA